MTDEVVVSKTSEKVEQKARTKCPKGMKLPGWVKRIAMGMRNATKAERRDFMRAMGTAMHEAAYKVRNANKMSAQPRNVKPTGPTTDAE